MEKTFENIPSFEVDHTKLIPGLYVSRIDKVGKEVITTYDIRLVRPNQGLEFSTGAMHALEHLGAYYLRNQPDVKEKIIYFGPMGCRTGFYLVMAGYYEPLELVPLLRSAFNYIIQYNGVVPGATEKECGNYRDMNLAEAKAYAKKYLEEFLLNPTARQTEYPR